MRGGDRMPGWDTSKWGFSTDILGLFGNASGAASSSLALWGGDSQRNQDAINGLGVTGGLSTVVNSAGNLANAGDKAEAGESILGIGSGIFNSMAGAVGLAGRGKDGPNFASNVMYGVGGGLGALSGAMGIANTVKNAKKNKDQSKLQTATGILSSGGGMLGGIGGMLMGIGGAKGKSGSSLAQAGKWISLIGSGAGMLGNVINLFAKSRAKKKAPQPQVPQPQVNAAAAADSTA